MFQVFNYFSLRNHSHHWHLYQFKVDCFCFYWVDASLIEEMGIVKYISLKKNEEQKLDDICIVDQNCIQSQSLLSFIKNNSHVKSIELYSVVFSLRSFTVSHCSELVRLVIHKHSLQYMFDGTFCVKDCPKLKIIEFHEGACCHYSTFELSSDSFILILLRSSFIKSIAIFK